MPTNELTVRTSRDQRLRELGLSPCRAWVEDTPTPKAQRNKRYRQKAAANGNTQLSAMVPRTNQGQMRQLCKMLRDGELTEADLLPLLDLANRQEDSKADTTATKAGSASLLGQPKSKSGQATTSPTVSPQPTPSDRVTSRMPSQFMRAVALGFGVGLAMGVLGCIFVMQKGAL